MPAPSAFHFFRLVQFSEPARVPGYLCVSSTISSPIYRTELAELAEAGCRYVQLDEVPMAMLCDPDVRRQIAAEGSNPEALVDTYVSSAEAHRCRPPRGHDLGLHLCRGNFRSRWMASGGYEPVAEKLFNEAPVDAFFLEYDSERAGDFRPLRFVPKGKRVVLGLVSSKNGQLEDQESLVRRIEEAERVPARSISSGYQLNAALPASPAATALPKTSNGTNSS